jgi:hypothetical protein
MNRLVLVIIVAVAAFTAAFYSTSTDRKNNSDHLSSGNSFAVLELFTSEGCSSCPPADRLLPELVKISPNIIPLSFHVDYWDRLGWKDPFGDAAYSDRQRDYGERFHLDGVYTPQLVVNGEQELVGSDRQKAEQAIQNSLHEQPKVSISINNLTKQNEKMSAEIELTGGLKNVVINFAVVQKHATTNVKAGENKGASLSHNNVVRSFIQEAAQSKINIDLAFPKGLAEDNWQLIIYAQQKNDLKIIGVAVYKPQLSLPTPD